MNVLPVITREMRAEARHAFTYWLRVIGAGVVLSAAMLFVFRNGMRVNQGGILFIQLHASLHAAIWLLVPLLTADCLSRERREGTLGLLFLTPLRATDIVSAKSLVHGLRASTILIAILPIVALPFLMGGVTWQQALSSLIVNFSALSFALAAGIIASAFSKSWTRALILAYFLTGFFFLIHLSLVALLVLMAFPVGSGFQIVKSSQLGLQTAFLLSPDFYATFRFFNPAAPTISPAITSIAWRLLTVAGIELTISLSALFIAILLAALITKRNWQQKPPNPTAEKLRAKFTTPVFALSVFHRWMKRSLDRNPIGWLERRTWSGRIVIWGWFAVMISVYSLLLTDANFLTNGFHGIHVFMGWTLIASLAMNASMSFHREREMRVLELLLISPLKESQIILGRLLGLWSQFLPSVGLLLAGWTYLCTALNKLDNNVGSMISIFIAFVSIPAIGLYFSLICRNFLAALMWTIAVGLVLPSIQLSIVHLVVMILRGTTLINFVRIDYLFHPALFQLALGMLLVWRLQRRLVHRRFATETT